MKLPRITGASILLLSVCCVQPDLEPRFTPAWEPFDPTEAGWRTTRRALLVADCQLHNLQSLAIPERNLSSEALASTTIRPPQLDLFSEEVLRWILVNGAPGAEVIFHLGDSLDLACEGEFEAFLRTMRSAGKPWFLAPGNHDSYYFGVYDPQDRSLWDDACHGAGRPFTKDRFIRRYVAALLQQEEAGCSALAAALGIADPGNAAAEELAATLPDEFEWVAEDNAHGFLRGICWQIDQEQPWRSFVLQSVEITEPDQGDLAVRVLLLDSCQYARRPELIVNGWQSYPLALNCGYTGQMLPNQLRKVRVWIEEWSSFDRTYTMMSHHPFESLEPRTRSSLGWLWRERGIGMMVSAHTHQGFFAHHDLDGEGDHLELNIASTTDWPMEWRTLQGHVNRDSEKIYLHAERNTLVDALSHADGYFQEGWEIPLDAPDDYRKYKQGESTTGILVDFALAHHLTPPWLSQPSVSANAAARDTEEQVKNTLLWTYHRLVRHFPTDGRTGEPSWPEQCANDGEVLARIEELTEQSEQIEQKIDLLRELAVFERTRRTRDPETGQALDEARTRYKISQAAWASRFEAERGRRLRVEDELIRFDYQAALKRGERRAGGG